MPPKYPCPKCAGNSWFEEVEPGNWAQRCMCGLMRFVVKTSGGITIFHETVPKSKQVLPQVGTKIHKCFRAVILTDPLPISTVAIANHSELRNKETSSLLISLLARGLVMRVEERRGLAGGSLWALSASAKDLLLKQGGSYGFSFSSRSG